VFVTTDMAIMLLHITFSTVPSSRHSNS
jgi:hypothetical protein